MTKGKSWLFWSEMKVFSVVTVILGVAEIVPPLVLAYVVGNSQVFWQATVIWILCMQVGYLGLLSVRTLKKQFKAVDNIAQVIRDAIDVANTEESIDIELNDVRPN